MKLPNEKHNGIISSVQRHNGGVPDEVQPGIENIDLHQVLSILFKFNFLAQGKHGGVLS